MTSGRATELTLVLLKPDALQRGLVGRILQRFEDAGIKIACCKIMHAPKEVASKHYGDLDVRYSPEVKQQVVEFLCSGPVMALVLEGIEVVEVVRKLIGPTDPKKALPGTIRGDFAHMSMECSKEWGMALPNLVHSSATPEEALREIRLWFGIYSGYRLPSDSKVYAPTYTHHTL